MLKRLRILLVDDDQDEYLLTNDLLADRSFISSKTEEIGFTLEWVSTFEAALESVAAQRHDVYLVDYLLGERDGLDFLREAIAMGCRSPIIIMTGQGNYEIDINAMRSGAADYLVKGQIDPQLLERSIRYAYERAQLLNTLNERATRDDLTGLFNRREILVRLDTEIARHYRFGRTLSLALLDVDNFKQINDTHGHQIGDEVLRRVAKLLFVALRAIDQSARYGGDEFLIMFPETTAEQAYQVAERIRVIMSVQPFYLRVDDGEPLQIQIKTSLGIACLPEMAKTRDELIEAADKALYSAKTQGRDCVVVFNKTNSPDLG